MAPFVSTLLLLVACTHASRQASVSSHVQSSTSNSSDAPCSELELAKRSSEDAQNSDRLTCLRQDDLDLVKPLLPTHAIRMVIGVGGDTTKDVYLSVDKLWIKEVKVDVVIKRTGKSSFFFQVKGSDTYDKYSDVAAVDFWLNGVDVLIRNSWMDWGASWAADRDLLAQGQNGMLRMKLFGEGMGVLNEETGEWEIKLQKKDTQPFYLQIDNQWVLEKVLNSFGGLDQLIMDNLWPAIEKAIPKSYAATLTYLDSNDLNTEVTARLTGSQTSPTAPLVVDLVANVVFDTVPRVLLKSLLDNFDPVVIAERQVKALLEQQDFEAMYNENKDLVRATLKRYGVVADFLDGEFNATLVETLKQRLVEKAKESADFMVQALQPFISAQDENRETNIFQGLGLALQAQVGWNHEDEDGRIQALLIAPEGSDGTRRKLLELPNRFLKSLGSGMGKAGDMLVPPPPAAPNAELGHSQLSLTDSKMTCKSVQMKNMRIKTGGENGTKKQVWKLGGAVNDIEVKLPKTLEIGWSVIWDSSDITLAPSGDMTVDYNQGVQIKQNPMKPVDPSVPTEAPKNPNGRLGSEKNIDGIVPIEYARPTQSKEDLLLPQLAPIVATTADVTLDGQEDRLKLQVGVTGKISISIGDVLAPTLAPRPTQDFGYVFYAGKFTRILKDAEDGLPSSSEKIAVVSCGHLRLLTPGAVATKKDPFVPIDWEPKNGQLQLDLSQYKGPPEKKIVFGKSCLVLYSNGYAPRSVYQGLFSSNTDADEKLCGSEEEVDKLRAAIALQVERFNTDRSKTLAWNYGTHPLKDENGNDLKQYTLAPGLETKSLTDIVDQVGR